MKVKLIDKMKYSFTKAKFKVAKHSPEILLGVGIVGVVGSVVVACVATTKASDIIEEANESLEQVKKCSDDPILLEKYSPEDKRKDLTIIDVKTGAKFVKLYFPAAALCAVSIFSIISSHRIMKRRNAEIAALYSALGVAFKSYRKRVTDALGEDADNELYYGIKMKEVETVEEDPETGKKKKKKDILAVVEDSPIGDYVEYFERPNLFAEKSIEGNLLFLRMKERLANDMLKAHASDGVPLFLNEVRKELGFPPTKIGHRVGWIYNPDDPTRDSEVKFRIQVVKKPCITDDGGTLYEDTIMIDFNVDGDVWSDWKE